MPPRSARPASRSARRPTAPSSPRETCRCSSRSKATRWDPRPWRLRALRRPPPLARDSSDAGTASASDAGTADALARASTSAADAATASAPDGGARAPSPAGQAPAARSAPFAILLVDNDGALRIDDAAPALLLHGLAPGPHLLRVVLSRPWGEVVKSSGAFALTRFWVGPRPPDARAAREQELKSWPDPHRALLTYVFPLGEVRRDLSLRAAGSASSEAAPAPPLPTPRALDFFLSLARLQEQGRGDKVRVVLNKRELPTQRAWRPLPLPLQPGKNRVTIDLLDRRSTKVKNAVQPHRSRGAGRVESLAAREAWSDLELLLRLLPAQIPAGMMFTFL